MTASKEKKGELEATREILGCVSDLPPQHNAAGLEAHQATLLGAQSNSFLFMDGFSIETQTPLPAAVFDI